VRASASLADHCVRSFVAQFMPASAAAEYETGLEIAAACQGFGRLFLLHCTAGGGYNIGAIARCTHRRGSKLYGPLE